MSMCDRIAIMKAGEIVQIATPAEMYNDPRTAFVAGFLGNPPITFLHGHGEQGPSPSPGSEIRVAASGPCRLADGSQADARRAARAFQSGGRRADPGKVTFAETQGRENLYDVQLAGGPLLRSIQPVRDDISIGDEVTLGDRQQQRARLRRKRTEALMRCAIFRLSSSATAGPSSKGHLPFCIGHRGASGHVRENTLEAFRLRRRTRRRDVGARHAAHQGRRRRGLPRRSPRARLRHRPPYFAR